MYSVWLLLNCTVTVIVTGRTVFAVSLHSPRHSRLPLRRHWAMGATIVGTGVIWSTTFRYWSPNFLAVVFKKQDISQQVVTRMQDLAYEFSKILGGVPPDPHSGKGEWLSKTIGLCLLLCHAESTFLLRCKFLVYFTTYRRSSMVFGPLNFSAVVARLHWALYLRG